MKLFVRCRPAVPLPHAIKIRIHPRAVIRAQGSIQAGAVIAVPAPAGIQTAVQVLVGIAEAAIVAVVIGNFAKVQPLIGQHIHQKMETIENLINTVIPTLFKNPENIGQYGIDITNEGMSELTNLLGQSPVSALANKLAEIVHGLNEANPKKIAKTPSWFERFTGAAVESHVRYQVARQSLETLIAQASSIAVDVRQTIQAIDGLIANHAQESERLGVYIAAGQQFLAQNPNVGAPNVSAIEFDNPRERFSRKLANLITLGASQEMSLSQMKLTKAQAIDMLDRFEETSRLLVPVWRSHTLALTSFADASSEQAAQAIAAHDALTKGIAKSMQPTNTIH